MKQTKRIYFVCLLLMFLVVSVALPVLAATITVSGLPSTVTVDNSKTSPAGSGSWTANGTTITGTASGGSISILGQYWQGQATLTFTFSESGTFSFDWALTNANGGYLKVDDTQYNSNTSGKITKTITASEASPVTVTVIINSKDGGGPTDGNLTNVTFVPKRVTNVTFNPVEGLSYEVGGYTVNTTNGAKTVPIDADATTITITPTYTNTGVKIREWRKADNTAYSFEEKVIPKPAEAIELTPVVANVDTAMFQVKGGSIYYYDWDAAFTAAAVEGASGIVVVAGDGTLPAGDYEVPSGMTLLVPFDVAHTLLEKSDMETESNLFDAYSDLTNATRKQFRKLTMASGAKITIASGGKLNVGSRVSNQFLGQSGAYGAIYMEEGSSITVEGGGTLYAWGYIFAGETGSGSVMVNDNAIVYEPASIVDYPGNSDLTNTLKTNGVLPVRAYTVRNVEVPMTLASGAKEYIFYSLWGSIVGCYPGYVLFFANASDGTYTPTFQLAAGTTLTKSYSDGIQYLTVCGDIALNSMTLTIEKKILGENVTISSSETSGFYLPSGFDVTISSGTMTLNDNVIMCEGAKLTIAKDAVVDTAEKTIYILDEAEDGGAVGNSSVAGYTGQRNGCYIDVSDVHGNYYSYVPTDSVLDVNGTLIVSGGFYTSTSGADITSSEGTGKIDLNATSAATNSVRVKDNQCGYYTIQLTAAQLHNADDTFTETTGASSTTYNYIDGYWVAAGCGRLDIVATNIAVNDGLDVRFYVDKADMEAGATYTAVITKSFADNRTPVTQIVPSSSWKDQLISESTTYMYFTFEDVSAKEMTDNIEVKIYLGYENAENPGVQVSNTFVETVQKYAIRTFEPIMKAIEAGTASDEDQALAIALADMLHYGAAAQVHFAYNTENLATTEPEELAEKYQGVLAQGCGYVTKSPVEMASNRANGDNFKGVTVSATNTLMFTFYFGIENPEGMHAQITYTDSSNTVHVLQEVQGSDFYARTPGSLYGVDVTELSIVDGRLLLTCTVYHDGEEYGSATDSIEGYAARKSDPTDDEIDIFERIMMFVDSAGDYFDLVSQSNGG